MNYEVRIDPILNIDKDAVTGYSVTVSDGGWQNSVLAENKSSARAAATKLIEEHEIFCTETYTAITRNGKVVSSNYS